MEGEPSQLKRAIIDASAGAISGAISRTVTSPLDVIKIRFQVQLEPTSSWTLLRKDLSTPSPSKYTSMLQASKDIFREEGIRGFWRGNVPALLMVMPYTAIQFTVLHNLKTFASGSSKTENHINLSPYLSYMSGALAGCAATVGSYPFDLLRTILASQGEPKAIDRGENLTILADKTETLCSQAQDFRKQGTRVRRKMWYQNMKIKLVVLGILLFLVLVIWLSICGGFNCAN